MATALVKLEDSEPALRYEFGPIGRALGRRYCPHVRVGSVADAELRRLSSEGFVVHVQRTATWVSFLYLAWLMVSRALPPIRAVFNMRRWFGRPWRRVAQRGPLDVRLEFARRKAGSALVFLRTTAIGRAGGKSGREDPFAALVALARKSDRPVFLVPELVVWEKWSVRLKPAWADYVFGTPRGAGLPPLGAGVLAQPQARPVPGGHPHRAEGLRRRERRRRRRGGGSQGARPPSTSTWRERPAPSSGRPTSPPSGSSTRRCATARCGRPSSRPRPAAARRCATSSARLGGISTPSPPASTPPSSPSWPR